MVVSSFKKPEESAYAVVADVAEVGGRKMDISSVRPHAGGGFADSRLPVRLVQRPRPRGLSDLFI